MRHEPPLPAPSALAAPYRALTLRQLLLVPDVRGALLVWWLVLVVASWVVSAPLLPALDVLGQVPFLSATRDLSLLHERSHQGAPVGAELMPVARAVFSLAVVTRLVLVAPTALALGAVVLSRRRRSSQGKHAAFVSPRLVSATARAFGNFLLLTLLIEGACFLLTMICLGLAREWLTAPTHSSFHLAVGTSCLVAALGVYVTGFVWTDVSRLSLFTRTRSSLPRSLLDGLEAISRQPRLVFGVGTVTCLVTLASSALALVAAALMSAAWPGFWGQAGAWLLAQVSTGLVLLRRVWGWHRLASGLQLIGLSQRRDAVRLPPALPPEQS